MLKLTNLPAALALGAALWLAAGCAPPPPPATPPVSAGPKTALTGPTADSGGKGQDMADTSAVVDAVANTVKKHTSLFPKGVKVESITVRGGVAAVDFNAEFNKLANLGDTTEAHAQKQLRAALAEFPAIQKMTVTVQGKPYDSQTSDWTTPFPVRLSEDEKSAAADTPATEPVSSQGGGR